ncbi:hypothetical protein [Streptomyces griseocarneus]|uniref:hypothetical protein n=1 Tax=Streptomyces griseocarneus TaxID=51201 RepID=UPI00167E97AE|nr:hypothetical protein [Streptomyces griseocarneus]MBZ6473703.1 hypothetical protein [Streptomyces griseocarneus]GHG64639.1 hypothetical protein GCM10018779_34700 [Streptomyces griseocarneus]
MKFIPRMLTALTATALFCAAGAALAAPAQADVDVHVVLVDAHLDGTIGLSAGGIQVISLPDPLDL